MSCKTSITTSSGTFSFSEKVMSRCEAKKYCRDKDAILAPITTQEDKDAVKKMLDSDCSLWTQYSDSTTLDLMYIHVATSRSASLRMESSTTKIFTDHSMMM